MSRSPLSGETSCTNGSDDDNDGDTDCDDSDCNNHSSCQTVTDNDGDGYGVGSDVTTTMRLSILVPLRFVMEPTMTAIARRTKVYSTPIMSTMMAMGMVKLLTQACSAPVAMSRTPTTAMTTVPQSTQALPKSQTMASIRLQWLGFGHWLSFWSNGRCSGTCRSVSNYGNGNCNSI